MVIKVVATIPPKQLLCKRTVLSVKRNIEEMQLLSSATASSSSSAKPSFPIFTSSISHSTSNFIFKVPSTTLRYSPSNLLLAPRSSNESAQLTNDNQQEESNSGDTQEIRPDVDPPERLLMVRRPVMEFPGEEVEEEEETVSATSSDGRDDVDDQFSSSALDAGLSKFAKKMPIFEPERVELSSEAKPLAVNLELALYRAKVLARSFQFAEAEKILNKVWHMTCELNSPLLCFLLLYCWCD